MILPFSSDYFIEYNQSRLFAMPKNSLAEFHLFRDQFLQRLIILQSSVINERLPR